MSSKPQRLSSIVAKALYHSLLPKEIEMFTKSGSKRSSLLFLAVLLAGVVVAAFATPRPALAHCDSEKGPVASAAIKALEKNNVNLVLPYVKPEAENELKAAFKQAVNVRKQGGTAKELADRYFVENAVRLHRTGEGAPYTGVTDETTPSAILMADKAMASGSLDETYKFLDQEMQKSIQQKYQAVVDARKEAQRLDTVEAHRERVEAELIFEKYIF